MRVRTVTRSTAIKAEPRGVEQPDASELERTARYERGRIKPMRLTPFVSAALALSISGPLFAQEWIEFASREDRFTCNFPTQPKVTETTYRSEFGADLPARVYSATQGPSRYSVTVVDYNQAQRILTEKAKNCPPGAETCSGG